MLLAGLEACLSGAAFSAAISSADGSTTFSSVFTSFSFSLLKWAIPARVASWVLTPVSGGGVLQGLPRLDLLLQTIVNLVVSHLLRLLVLLPLCHWLSTGPM